MKALSRHITAYWLPVIVFLIRSIRGEDFFSMKEEIANSNFEGLEPLVLGQSRLLEEMSAFAEAKSKLFIGDTSGTQDESDFCHKGYQHLQEAQVHTDVVFVGFPASVLEHIGEKWLKSLSSDATAISQGSYGRQIFDIPGDITIRHHFHLVEVSFHVADVVRDKLALLLRDALKEDVVDMEEGVPINAWEIDEMLTSLTTKLTTNGPDFVHQNNLHHYTPANTIYILNVDLDTTWNELKRSNKKNDRRYWYRSGFTEAQLSSLAAYPDVVVKSRAVLKEAEKTFASRVTMPQEDNSQEKATLVERDAETQVEKMIGYSGWPTAHNWDDYGYGTDDHYRKVTSHIHHRKAITESREWAQEWGDNVGMTLEARALHMLRKEDEGGVSTYGDSRYVLAEAVVRHAKEAVDGPEDDKDKLQRDPGCGSGVWVGRGSTSWVDEHASGRWPRGYPQLPRQQGEGRNLGYQDWQGLLQDNKEDSQIGATDSTLIEAQRKLDRLTGSISAHYATVLQLARQVQDCPLDIRNSLPTPHDLLHAIKGEVESPDTHILYARIERLFRVGHLSMSCAALLQQAGFLSSVIIASSHLRTDSSYLLDKGKDREERGELDDMSREELLRVEETFLWVQRLQHVHVESLSDVLSTSALVDSEMYVGLFLPSKVAEFFGRVMTSVLSLSRSATAPPLALHINAHAAALPLPHDTTLINGDSHAATARQSTTALDREQLATGIASAGLAGFVAAGVEEEEEEKVRGKKQSSHQSQALWAHTLPPLSFPQRVDVVVYVVSLQSNYHPLAREAGESQTGLDFQQIVRALSQLKLRNQEMSVSLRKIDVVTGKGGALDDIRVGMDVCLRSTQDLHRYLDASCFWALIRSNDIDVSGDKKERSWIAANQHVPVFVLSVDEQHPLFVSLGKQTAIVSGDGVLAVQNRQRRIATGRYCGEREVIIDGRNPTGATLGATAKIIAGLSTEGGSGSGSGCSQSAPSLYAALMTDNEEDGKETTTQQSFGSSVTFSSTGEAELGGTAFSDVTVMGAHRARIMRAAGISSALLRESVIGTLTGSRERRQAVTVRAFFTAVIGKVLYDLDTVNEASLHLVAAQMNAVFFLTQEWVHTKTLPQRIMLIIAQKLGDVDFLDREPYASSYPRVEAIEGEGFLSVIGYRNVVIFVLVAIATFAWPSKKKKKSRLL